ncbi:Zinc finger protein 1-like protein [Plakobranchus ocellatus]|uniref:Zinc finger protein 1-like protein n=1 Tax=Plakobranchus ocellatus TaxID=259542 RepID=A0AAV3ZBM6_9GAST|nr:Zinc finger protein 1-like protein [Plakobranchus ocellatus]
MARKLERKEILAQTIDFKYLFISDEESNTSFEQRLAYPQASPVCNNQAHQLSERSGLPTLSAVESHTYPGTTGSGRILNFDQSQSGMRPYHCELCGKGFFSRGGLFHHRKTHSSKRFQCPECNAKFLHKHHLKGHVRNVHGSLICFPCGKTYRFFEQKLFDNHLMTCKNKK